MSELLSTDEAITKLQGDFEQRITQGVKSLLESKHLYQSIRLEYQDLLDTVVERGTTWPVEVRLEFPKLAQANWLPIDNASRGHVHPGRGDGPQWGPIRFNPSDVRLYCKPCERIEAFNNISGEDFLQRERPSDLFKSSGGTVQIFVLSFLCQSCKAVPEVFLIRREGLKLTNSGRSPIEYVDVPSFIPRAVRRFYSGALVAHQSGETLAGIFMLRTLIEQWARSIVPDAPPDADKLMDAYMATLPEDFKARFPSLPSLYKKLSEDMHAAQGDPNLFENARAGIDKHFEARRVYDL